MSLLGQFNGDVDKILRYAFRVSGRPIIAGASIFKQMLGTGIRVQTSASTQLSEHEQHAQAALIFHAVEALEGVQHAIIYGYYDRTKRESAVRTLDAYVEAPRNLPHTIKTILIREWLERDNRRQGRHLKREQHHLVDTGQIPRALTGSQLHYARVQVFRQMDVIDTQARDVLATKWAH